MATQRLGAFGFNGSMISLETGLRLALRDFVEQKPSLTEPPIAPILD